MRKIPKKVKLNIRAALMDLIDAALADSAKRSFGREFDEKMSILTWGDCLYVTHKFVLPMPVDPKAETVTLEMFDLEGTLLTRQCVDLKIRKKEKI